jgi:hypothetical protein
MDLVQNSKSKNIRAEISVKISALGLSNEKSILCPGLNENVRISLRM